VTTKLPPGVKLGKDGDPGETLSTSDWPTKTPLKSPYAADVDPDEDSVYDERKEDEEIQPGDLVILQGPDGEVYAYTEPEGIGGQ
jgi:hypothetical protein